MKVLVSEPCFPHTTLALHINHTGHIFTATVTSKVVGMSDMGLVKHIDIDNFGFKLLNLACTKHGVHVHVYVYNVHPIGFVYIHTQMWFQTCRGA